MTSSIFGSVAQYSIFFCCSKLWNYLFDFLNIKLEGLKKAIALNLISAICSALFTNPIWVVNARMAKKGKDVFLFYLFRKELLEI